MPRVWVTVFPKSIHVQPLAEILDKYCNALHEFEGAF